MPRRISFLGGTTFFRSFITNAYSPAMYLVSFIRFGVRGYGDENRASASVARVGRSLRRTRSTPHSGHTLAASRLHGFDRREGFRKRLVGRARQPPRRRRW